MSYFRFIVAVAALGVFALAGGTSGAGDGHRPIRVCGYHPARLHAMLMQADEEFLTKYKVGTDSAGLIADAVGVAPRRVNYIAFSGGGEALAAVLGGQVSVGINGLAEFAAQIEAGTVRPLAISSAERLPGLDIPTLREQGLDIEFENWRSVVAPPGIDAADRRRLDAAVGAMVRSAEWKDALERYRWIDRYLAGDAFARFTDAEERRVQDIIMKFGTREGSTPSLSAAGPYPIIVLSGLLLCGLATVLTWRRTHLNDGTAVIEPVHGGESVALRPPVVVNATGAWGDFTLRELGVPSRQLFGGTKGSHIITFHHSLREQLGDGGVYAEAADGRLVFVLPMGQAKLPAIAAADIGACAFAIFAQGPELAGRSIGIAGEHLSGAQMAEQLTLALGEPVRHVAMPPEQYAKLGFPGADELANMFQFKRDFERRYCAARDVAGTRELHPGLATFAAWLAHNRSRLPIQAAA